MEGKITNLNLGDPYGRLCKAILSSLHSNLYQEIKLNVQIALHICFADGVKETLSPNQWEDNQKVRASLVKTWSKKNDRGELGTQRKRTGVGLEFFLWSAFVSLVN
ncbi:MAG: hypothetical protein PHD88_04350 [Firmicutes bacterium]|nr:hypothetical protein [Bacillota bacterium]MDD4693622.1 hypothetical protein [Bacillota bacterium]